MLNSAKINVAIDGPAGAGKSTVARQVASELGYIYIDTGAMYRSVAWEVMRREIPATDPDRIGKLASELHIELSLRHSGQHVLINGEDVTDRIRQPEVSRLVSQIAAIHEVRTVLVEMQKRMAASKGVVMDGRDIGSHVIPDAEVKIFLTASVEERARRRYVELNAAGSALTYEQIVQDIAERDRMDREREVAPLVQTPDAIRLDSTGLTSDEVAHKILIICRDVLDKGEVYG